jgi:hypothetical protein
VFLVLLAGYGFMWLIAVVLAAKRWLLLRFWIAIA